MGMRPVATKAPERTKEAVMRRIPRGLAVMLVLAGLQLSACTQKVDTPSQAKPAKVEKFELKRKK